MSMCYTVLLCAHIISMLHNYYLLYFKNSIARRGFITLNASFKDPIEKENQFPEHLY